MARHLFTSESVTEGHPDKICDQISDAILDEILAQDPDARVACETCVSTGLVHIMGEITTSCYVDFQKLVREVVADIGYTRAKYGFDADTCAVISNIDGQSPDIALGTNDEVGGAGDQGMMFGYACDETPELMPLPISLAHKLARRLAEVRKNGEMDYLRPDGKSQVTVEYDDGRPVRVDTVVISTQHREDVSMDALRADVMEKVIKAVIPANLLDENTKYFINPTGGLSSAGPRATAASPAARSLWTPTAALPATAAAPSRARTPARWTAALPTPPAGWPRTWWPPAWPAAARCRWPTPSAWPSLCPSWWTPSAPAWWTTTRSRPLWRRSLT